MVNHGQTVISPTTPLHDHLTSIAQLQFPLTPRKGNLLSEINVERSKSKLKVKIEYFTDPLCAWSYVSEPTIESIITNYGDSVDFQFRSIPLVDRIEGEPRPGLKTYSAEFIGGEWAKISNSTGVKINSDLWKEDPPHSSWPANRAMKAGLRQGFKKGFTFLHNLRNAVMQDKVNPSNMDSLKYLAQKSGLDVDKFYREMTENVAEIEQEIKKDHLEASTMCITKTPTMLLYNDEGDKVTIEGTIDYEVVSKAISFLSGKKAYGKPTREPVPSI